MDDLLLTAAIVAVSAIAMLVFVGGAWSLGALLNDAFRGRSRR